MSVQDGSNSTHSEHILRTHKFRGPQAGTWADQLTQVVSLAAVLSSRHVPFHSARKVNTHVTNATQNGTMFWAE